MTKKKSWGKKSNDTKKEIFQWDQLEILYTFKLLFHAAHHVAVQYWIIESNAEIIFGQRFYVRALI